MIFVPRKFCNIFLLALRYGMVCLVLVPLVACADSNADTATATSPVNEAPGTAPPKAEGSDDQLVVTQHRTKIGDQEIEYTATAGTLVVRRDAADAKPRASIFFVAYTRNGTKDLGNRPISFCFNGGPGSSSVWLHLGMLGPRRVPIRICPTLGSWRGDDHHRSDQIDF